VILKFLMLISYLSFQYLLLRFMQDPCKIVPFLLVTINTGWLVNLFTIWESSSLRFAGTKMMCVQVISSAFVSRWIIRSIFSDIRLEILTSSSKTGLSPKTVIILWEEESGHLIYLAKLEIYKALNFHSFCSVSPRTEKERANKTEKTFDFKWISKAFMEKILQ